MNSSNALVGIANFGEKGYGHPYTVSLDSLTIQMSSLEIDVWKIDLIN
jgi:hypothetical protein